MVYGDNVVIKFFNKATDLLVLNLLFILCCLPVVTVGAALSAMYAVNLRSIRYGDGYIVKTFFKAFKQSFFQATGAWFLFCAFAAILFADYRFWIYMGDSGVAKYMQILSLVIAFLLGVVFLWLFPVIAKMKDRFFRQVKNASALAYGYFLPYTAVCMGLVIMAGYTMYKSAAMMIVFLLIGFAVLTYMQSFFFYKVFSKFIIEAPVGEDDPLYSQKVISIEKEREKKAQNL